MYSTFLTSSSGSVLFRRTNPLKRKDLCFSCLRLGLIRHRRSLRSSNLFSIDGKGECRTYNHRVLLFSLTIPPTYVGFLPSVGPSRLWRLMKFLLFVVVEKIRLFSFHHTCPSIKDFVFPTTVPCRLIVRFPHSWGSCSPICVHKVDTRSNSWSPRMVGQSAKLHNRGKISEREVLTRKFILCQGPTSRYPVHQIKVSLQYT